MPLKIVRNDITKMNTEAIVNTANEYPTVGSGCDIAVYKAAGYDELLKFRKEKIGSVPEGEAFITPGFNLPAKYIIHAVSPLFQGGDEREEEKLRSCYRNSLKIAKENGIRSIAFPLIATGSFGYPKEEGMRIAVDEMNTFLLYNKLEIFLVVFGDEANTLGKKIYPELEEYIDQNYVADKREEEYSEGFYGSTDFSDEEAGEDIDNERFGRFRRRREAAARKKEANISGMGTAAAYHKMAAPRLEASSMAKSCSDEADKGFLDFETEHESKLNERMQHISDTFSQYLMYLIHEKKMENADVYKRAIVDKKIFSKIKNNIDYHPQKLTALCLCMGARLNLDESKDLLARAGYALSPCDKVDIIFSYFIENQIYDMIELDIQLEEHGLPCIIT